MIEDRHRNIASERSINLTLSLVTNSPNKNLSFPCDTTFKNGIHKVSYTDEWNEVCFHLLDFITTKALDMFYDQVNGGLIPKNPYCDSSTRLYRISFEYRNDVSYINKKLKSFKIRINEKYLRSYIQFKDIPIAKLRKAFECLKMCKFTLPYGVRLFDENTGSSGKYKTVYFNINDQSICDFKIANERLTPSGKITDRDYLITVDSLLGRMIIYNTCMINIDWISNLKFYKLKPKTQLFARKFILPNISGKVEKRYDDANLILNFSHRFDYIKRNINSCLNDLTKNGFIHSLEFERKSFAFKLNNLLG